MAQPRSRDLSVPFSLAFNQYSLSEYVLSLREALAKRLASCVFGPSGSPLR